MPFTAKERQKVEKLRRRYRIDFLGEVPRHEWPESHRSTFNAVEELGRKQFDTYAVDLTTVETAPWSADVKKQAEDLTERAKRCVRRNESTWRFACEPYALARLTSEVVCKRCRNRVWRSEIEATREEGSRKAEALRARQRKRQPCRCPRDFRKGDAIEAVGLNRIFSHREDEPVHHESSIEKELPRATKPDAIYGLRQTRNIENLLNDKACPGTPEDEQDKLVHEILGESPLSEEGDPILFPFLVLEAKSGKAAESDWISIQLQSAFPVRTLLCAQTRLKEIAESSLNRNYQKPSPLVWLVMNKGEDWRVCAACVKHDAGRKSGTVGSAEYQIFDLWGGSITSKNGAVQLLLIVDYVFEWARDIYREDILSELRSIASGQNDSASMVHPDTDIFSTLTSMHLSVPHEDDRLIQDSYDQGMNAFKAMDSQHGVVRHATFIESHYRCFFVTRDNVATMLQSTDQPATQTLARQIITQLHEIPLLISWACLNMMEEQWTGRTRMPRFYHLDETKFYASVTYSSFLMPDWVQVRELVVIAVAQDAFECLATAAKYSRISASMPPPVEQGCDMEVVKDLVTKLRAGNARHTLLAAIKRKCLRFAGEGSSVYLVPSNGVSRDIVHYLYNYFKKGRMPPQEPFMNISTSSDQTNLATSSKEPFDFGGLNVSEDGCVLAYATGHNHDPGRRKMSSICIFFTDGPPDLPTTERLGTVIKHTYENYDVYHTSRIHRAPNYRELGKKKKEEGNRWNIRNSYGIFSEGFHFLHWLAVLECPLPVRQGSPRDGVLWAPVFSRHHFPWREPGYIYMDLAERVFVIYKTVIQEVHYWRSVARERRARGIECCEICAFEETMAEGKGICRECEFELCEIHGEDWFRRALLGDRPIDYRPIDTEIEGEGYKRLRIPDDEMRDLNAKFERTLSFYEDLDEEFEDLGQLEAQTARFVAIHRELERYFPRKRKRSPTIVPSETE